MGVWFSGLVDGWVFLLTFWYLTAYLKHLSLLQGYFLKISRSSDIKKQTRGEEEGQEARAEGGVEVDEKW